MKYEKCLSCNDLGTTCDGPNFLAMETAEMGQWCNDKRKQIPGMTYDKIAAETGISKSAVYGFLNGTHSDYRLETIRPIVRLITGGKWDDNACGNLSNSEKAKYEDTIHHLEDEIKWRDDKIEILKEHISDNSRVVSDRYEFLKRKDHIITLLGVLLGITALVIIAALVVDALSPNIGFFWVQ